MYIKTGKYLSQLFFIVSSIRKIRSIGEFDEQEKAEFTKLVSKIRKGMKDVLGIDDVYIFQREDSRHSFHLWMVPRYDWMEKFGRGISSIKPIIDYAEENMATDEIIAEVKEAARKMKEYFK